ncbi:MAG TPA: VOC family protein, partial [Terriglobales bacterium]|nr:VOC family protein [Terriglobales bacterium]
NHLTAPVKNRYRAARFYIVVLGAEAHHESAPDRAAKGLARSLQVGVCLAPGFEIDLFEQDFGQPHWDQSHPHLALDTSAKDLERWAVHFKKWQVPFVGPMTRAGTKGAEIYFNDPDGNHLEIHCSNVPPAQRARFPIGPYDKILCMHKQEWPPQDLADEAERLFQASLARMRARRKSAVE